MPQKLCLALALALALAGAAPAPPADRARADYAPVARLLEKFIAREMADKELPAVSVALVDDQQTVWVAGFGLADPQAKTPAGAETVYRVGSVSKLFTDLAVMQLVERGTLDLDAPVERYLPDFKPRNSFGRPVTLRQLMSHRSGLVREPPVGNYFDPSGPSLAATVASLNRTALVYAPGARIKYSNAAIAAVGYVLERAQREPFPRYLKRALLEPLGMGASGFEPTPEITRHLARAFMWTIDGRVFPAPTFELGIAPAGSMYTSVADLARFTSVLFAGGRGPRGQMLKPETLAAMWTPQFARPGEKGGFGIGFSLSELEGRRRVGHGGAIYGFATALAALPDEKLGAVVVTTKDSANSVTDRIADLALRAMLAAREGRPLPEPDVTSPVAPELARRLAGRYADGEDGVELSERGGMLSRLWLHGGFPARLRAAGDGLITDDRLTYGERITPRPDGVEIQGKLYRRAAAGKPQPARPEWRGLVGEYGWDHDILYILEMGGRLWALIEWYEFDPLEQVSENVFKFPDRGLYDGEQLIFKRDGRGRATEVEAASVVFKRRQVGPEDGAAQLRVKPVRPVKTLLKEAMAMQPPQEGGEFRQSDLVELVKLDPTIKLDVRYATTNNFLGTVFYAEARAFLQRSAAEALTRAHQRLREQGYGLLVFDGYRPWSVTKVFWEATPDDKKTFVADPSKGSRHNRGCAVDLTLYDLATGREVAMPSPYDDMTEKAYVTYDGGDAGARERREVLRDAMEREGFFVYPYEWWHFDYKDWREYPILDVPFGALSATAVAATSTSASTSAWDLSQVRMVDLTWT
ncbi:MAG TPA: serine hydrolase, partial [Blastocatellia bacterium]|nr:serine hydrolase [Blastocatellia bacterium]